MRIWLPILVAMVWLATTGISQAADPLDHRNPLFAYLTGPEPRR